MKLTQLESDNDTMLFGVRNLCLVALINHDNHIQYVCKLKDDSMIGYVVNIFQNESLLNHDVHVHGNIIKYHKF